MLIYEHLRKLLTFRGSNSPRSGGTIRVEVHQLEFHVELSVGDDGSYVARQPSSWYPDQSTISLLRRNCEARVSLR